MREVDVLRADFRTVRDWMVRYGEWTVDQGSEIGAAIADAVQRRDTGEPAFWGDWMARYAVMARAHQDQMAALDREAAAWWMGQQRRAA
jgi:hypothetical protein